MIESERTVEYLASVQRGGTGYYADLCPRCGEPFDGPAWMFPTSLDEGRLRVCMKCEMDETERREAGLPPLPVGDWALVREIECDSRAAGALQPAPSDSARAPEGGLAE